MAGRRLRDSVKNELGDWARYIVLAGYANGFAGYVTTPQESRLQQYEGARALDGRWCLPAYQQVASQLASALQSGTAVTSNVSYDDWRGKAVGKSLPIGAAGPPRRANAMAMACPWQKRSTEEAKRRRRVLVS